MSRHASSNLLQPSISFNYMQKHQPVSPPCACLFSMHRLIEANPSIRPHASMHSTCGCVISSTTSAESKHGAAHNHAYRAEPQQLAAVSLLSILPQHRSFHQPSAFPQPTTRHQQKHHNVLVISPCGCITKVRQKPTHFAVPSITF